MKRGFTLIELLVVVLIIGILAAIALPQYTKAVEKSRAAEAITWVRSYTNAYNLWRMGPGAGEDADHVPDEDELDITLPSSKYYTCWFAEAIEGATTVHFGACCHDTKGYCIASDINANTLATDGPYCFPVTVGNTTQIGYCKGAGFNKEESTSASKCVGSISIEGATKCYTR
ncbi:prepilin-type N-terminal cleavage/methylation domain-containing protein [Elusimicrobium simillimum]|uniref:type IV pilin protein n=1 Tax=Elusimicrobium simillimum TaxID=3143438 RepID=UPI003C6EE67A